MLHKFTLIIACAFSLTASFAQTQKQPLPDTVTLSLKEMMVLVNAPSKSISQSDLKLRPVGSAQEMLRSIPGLFVAQHAGGGKAEQLFMRGFDIDHGTDFAIFVDGMPVNMTSHAHGQGYADLHFLIPETVQNLTVNKGPYTTKYGDLATSGAGEFTTANALKNSTIQLEAGMFNTKRALVMLDLLNKKNKNIRPKENLYVAGEYKYTDAFFQSKQNFNRTNFFGKYSNTLKNGAELVLNASNFSSKWSASGQIPERSVNDGSISIFGSIDDTEGGNTSRSNFTAIYSQKHKKFNTKSQIYYSKYDFNLYSNFTFFLKDSINGDQINQKDDRNLMGYNTVVTMQNNIGGKPVISNFGTGFRYDNADIQLNRSVKRNFLSETVHGKLNQLNTWVYADESVFLRPDLKMEAGARLDVYRFDFMNKTVDSLSGKTLKAIVSPKLNFTYNLNSKVDLFLRSGFGFHSNDARAVVLGSLQNSLPRALGYELGTDYKPTNNLVFNVALWALHLQSELIYVGDEGVVEASGRTKRLGIDAAARLQIKKYLFLDADLNFNYGRLLDEPSTANFIPLAPVLTSIGGISYKKSSGLNASLRYRYMANRAANEDYSLVAKGYFLLDGVVAYTQKRYQISLSGENLLNTVWKETQFATESRLKNELKPAEEIHFTPGTPLNIKATIALFF